MRQALINEKEGKMEEKEEILDGSDRHITGNQFTITNYYVPKAMLEFTANDEVYYMGKLIESDKEIIKILKSFILSRMWKV